MANILYQNIVSDIALFFTLFKGYKCDKLREITPKEMGARENKYKNWENIVMHIDFINLWNLRLLKFVFLGSDKDLFFGVISYNLLHL